MSTHFAPVPIDQVTEERATGTLYSSAMTLRTDVTVAAIVQRDHRFLLVEERASRRVVLNQPAGHLEAGESLFEAVVREALEETAWRFTPETLTGVYLWKNPANGRAFLRVAFAGRVDGFCADRPLDHGILRTLWLTRSELAECQERHRSPLVLRCVDAFLAGRRFPLEVLTQMPVSELSSRAVAV